MPTSPCLDTSPSSSTSASAAGGRTLAVRWVFPDTSGRLLHLQAPRLLLGRDDDCDFPVPGKETSRHHAEIVRDGPVAILRDLDSTNGVFVNGARVREAPLEPGDVVRVGEWIGVVLLAVAGSAEASPALRTLAQGLYGGPTLCAALEPARRAAASDLPVVVEGETGTGKERVARAVHAWSGRGGAFVAVNCASLPDTLAEAELFGYRKGAFTGADRASPGHFRAADRGTLLLDELTDLPHALQGKLLRVLEQKEVVPIGETRPVPIDVRVVAASQEPLRRAVEAGKLRADLLARLEGLTVRLPPVRERVDEVPYVFARLLQDHSGGRPPAVEPKLVENLCLYDWPFNVREIDLLARRLLALHGHEPALRRSHLPERILGARAGRPNDAAAQHAPARADSSRRAGATAEAAAQEAADARRERELASLVAALRRNGGVLARAASELGMSRQRAYRLLQGQSDVGLEELRAGHRDQASTPPAKGGGGV
jgi:DNA-binding NtrC family response regulator